MATDLVLSKTTAERVAEDFVQLLEQRSSTKGASICIAQAKCSELASVMTAWVLGKETFSAVVALSCPFLCKLLARWADKWTHRFV